MLAAQKQLTFVLVALFVFVSAPCASAQQPDSPADAAVMPAGSDYFATENPYGGCCPTTCCEESGLLGRGFIKRSDHAFDNFISPMTKPRAAETSNCMRSSFALA